MNKIAFISAFMAGAAIGVGSAYYILKKRYKEQLRDEIDSVKAVYAKKAEGSAPKMAATVASEPKSSLSDYNSLISENKYAEIIKRKEETANNGPYVIFPEEFGRKEDYEQISLTYYDGGGREPGVLVDEYDELVDVNGTVGADFIDHFGDYWDDCVHIRNDERQTDYEIVTDKRAWSDILREKPYLQDRE